MRPIHEPVEAVLDIDSRARTHMANERTFHAWFRTGLAVVALGLAAGQLLTPDVAPGFPFVRVLATLAIATGALVIMGGLIRYQRNRERIEAGRFVPAGPSLTIAALGGLAVGVFGVAFVWLLR